MLPLLTLVWKGATLASRLANLETTVKEKVEKFCKDHSEMSKKLSQSTKRMNQSLRKLRRP